MCNKGLFIPKKNEANTDEVATTLLWNNSGDGTVKRI